MTENRVLLSAAQKGRLMPNPYLVLSDSAEISRRNEPALPKGKAGSYMVGAEIIINARAFCVQNIGKCKSFPIIEVLGKCSCRIIFKFSALSCLIRVFTDLDPLIHTTPISEMAVFMTFLSYASVTYLCRVARTAPFPAVSSVKQAQTLSARPASTRSTPKIEALRRSPSSFAQSGFSPSLKSLT